MQHVNQESIKRQSFCDISEYFLFPSIYIVQEWSRNVKDSFLGQTGD